MRRTIEITTSAYDKPYITNCMYEDGDAFLKLKWKQLHEGDRRETVYDLCVDKDTGVVTINRTGLYKGNPSRYPWYFQVDQFRAKEKKSPNGTLQYEGSTVKDKVSAFINISDDDALKLFHRVNRFVELWEIAYGIPLIKEGGKMLDAERGNYQ